MKNRYDSLRKWNKQIISLSPANQFLRIILSLEIKKITEKKYVSRVLDIGCGEGDSIKYIMNYNKNLDIDALDISDDMINTAKKELYAYRKNIKFVYGDAFIYLANNMTKYDIITSSWTIHNFTWNEKIEVFREIFRNLSIDGSFLMMDKIYSDDEELNKKMLDIQFNRYKYLDSDIRKYIIRHEKQDFTKNFRMDETRTIAELEKIGFRNVRIIDRVEREVVLCAKK